MAKPNGSALPANRLKTCKLLDVNPFNPQRRCRCGMPRTSASMRHRSSTASEVVSVAFSGDNHSTIFVFVKPCKIAPLRPMFKPWSTIFSQPCLRSQAATPLASRPRKRARLATKHVVSSCSKRFEIFDRKQQRLPSISSGSTSEPYQVTPAHPSICKHFSAHFRRTALPSSLASKSRHQPPVVFDAVPKPLPMSAGSRLVPSHPCSASKLGVITSVKGSSAARAAQTFAALSMASSACRISRIRNLALCTQSASFKLNNVRPMCNPPLESVLT
mmetsp:Transcript_112947/g.326281  ORF Transcript_112947/g.326281 Transcript_112947/m.326281 type:complete len:274 (-) Transcript_112947:497-1318(-)